MTGNSSPGSSLGSLRRKLSGAWLVLITVLVVSGACMLPLSQAWASEENVSIDLEEVSKPEEELHIGQAIDRLFMVRALEDDCYIRLRTTMDAPTSFALFDYESPSEDGWHLGSDGWWYLEKPLARGDEATFSSSMIISGNTDIRSRNASMIELSEKTTAEALSARSVDPDWDDEDPWAGIKPDASAMSPGAGNGSWLPGSKATSMDVRNAARAGGLAQTFDDSDPLLSTALVAAIFALCLLLMAVGYHRYKQKEEMAFPKFGASGSKHPYGLEDIDEKLE